MPNEVYLSPFALAASIFIAHSTTPWDRAEAALSKAKGVTAKMSFTVGSEKPAKGSFILRAPDLMKIRLSSDKVDFEFRQSPQASVYYDHRSKTYQWWPWYPEAVPPPTTGQMLQLCYPQYYAQCSLKVLGPKSVWSTARQEKIGTVDTDVIVSSASGGNQNSLWIDGFGRILRHKAVFQRQGGALELTADYTNIEFGPVDNKVFEIDLPAGYEPENAPRINDTAVVGQRVKLTKGYRLPEEAPEDLGPLGGLAPVMVVVTSEDLEPSPDGDAWPRLASESKKLGIGFVQVWVGIKPKFQKKPWTQFWDRDGSLERRLGPPVTPYVYVIEKGVVVSGWQGRVGDDLEAVKKALFRPWQNKED